MKKIVILAGVLVLFACGRGSQFPKAMEETQNCIEQLPADKADSCQKQFFIKYKMPIRTTDLKDGKFTGTTTPDNEGYTHEATITVKYGVVVSAFYDEWKNGKAKSTDSVYCAQADSIKKGTNPKDIFRYYEQQLLVKQNIMEIDPIAGTTKTLFRVRMAASLALDKAQ